MQRLTRTKTHSRIITTVTLLITAVMGLTYANAAPPYAVQHANYDFEGAGYVTPAGMVPPAMYSGGVMPVGYYQGGCDSCGSGCDSMGYSSGCDSLGCGIGGCGLCSGADDGCGILGCGGVIGSMYGGCGECGDCGGGCDSCGGGSSLSSLRHICFFCRGGGCSACQFLNPAAMLAAMQQIRPYGEAGLCALRWYDLSADVVLLGHSGGGPNFAVTSQGVDGPRVLGVDSSNDGGELAAGMRFSAAMIFGPGANLEATYMGNNSWSGRAAVNDPNAQLFSFISEFGTNPGGVPPGYDDTDRSLVQSITTESDFHSGELNYRRRTMGPYCRFQGSWLVGLRYLRFKNELLYAALGENDNTVNANLPRFFSSNDSTKNSLFGPQAGFDVWWNMQPGIQLGLGFTGAWVQNNIKRNIFLTANSLSPTGAPGTLAVQNTRRDTTVMGEFDLKMIYRLSHSWSFRSAYYLIAADDIAFASVDANAIRGFVDPTIAQTNAPYQLDSLVVQGFSFGAEYIW